MDLEPWLGSLFLGSEHSLCREMQLRSLMSTGGGGVSAVRLFVLSGPGMTQLPALPAPCRLGGAGLRAKVLVPWGCRGAAPGMQPQNSRINTVVHARPHC